MKKSVLIVDDLPHVRKTLAKILREAHYNIVGEAEDGVEAIELYKKLRPDILTMDIVMPRMSGIEAAQHILKFDKGARVIVISAMGQEQLLMEAIQAGVRDYILKPFNPNEVLRTFQHIFSEMATIES